MIKVTPTKSYALLMSLKFFIIGVLLLISALFYLDLLIIVSIIFLALGMYQFFYIIMIEYEISDETIIIKKGIVSRTLNTVELYRVRDYITQQSVIERILSLMTLKIFSNDISSPILELKGIPYSDLMLKIRNKVQLARANNRIFETL